jgi:hypothetical protein
MQIDAFILQGSPEPFDEDVVEEAAFAFIDMPTDLPPEAPSFIVRVCGFGFHILHHHFGQARGL